MGDTKWGNKVIKIISDAPLARVFIFIGVFFFGAGILGSIKDYFRINDEYRYISMTFGMAFILLGAVIEAVGKLKGGTNKLLDALKPLQTISEQIRTDVNRLKEDTNNHFNKLNELSQRMGAEIVNLTDVTRRLLRDFPDIFDKAEDMLAESHDRFWVLNFTPCFGDIHSYNKKYVLKCVDGPDPGKGGYDEIRKSLETRITTFGGHIETKAETIGDFKLATIHPDDYKKAFVEPVINKIDIDDLIGKATDIEKDVIKRHGERILAVQIKCKNNTKCKNNDNVVYLDKVPLQMFIGDTKDGHDTCLVFFIGSDNINAEQEVKGFYTEYPPLVSLFKEIFISIIQQHARNTTVSTIREKASNE